MAYSKMVGACLDKAMGLGVTSRKKIHEAIYNSETSFTSLPPCL